MFSVNLRFLPHCEKIWKCSDRLEVDLFKEKHTLQTEHGPCQKVKEL